MGTLTGRYALVTGGGTGIGLGCARHLLADGAVVTLAGRRLDVLERAAAQLGAEVPGGEPVRAVVCDVTDPDQVATAVAAASPAAGLDIAIVNAGFGSGRPFLSLDLDEWRSIYETNVLGAVSTIKHAALAMKDRGGGSIVAISSIAAALGGRYRSVYASSKAALDMIVRTTADELGPFGIRVNSVRPGLVESEATERITSAADGPLADVQADYLNNMTLGRLGTADDVGALVRFLAGPESSWVTGQNWAVDGGHTLRRAPNMDAAMRAQLGDDVVTGLLGPRMR
jgi:NAD(P)-dependent dehydrogenase (short-subunit alcohol dehydrogenase family)